MVFELQTINHLKKPAHPPILLDSGASWSVAGESWTKSRGLATPPPKKNSDLEFLLGDGPEFPSLCELVLIIRANKGFLNIDTNICLLYRIDIVRDSDPLLISLNSLVEMHRVMDFSEFASATRGPTIIKLHRSPSGHILLPGTSGGHYFKMVQPLSTSSLFPFRTILRIAVDY